MGQILHGSARTTEAVRRAIQHSQESLRVLAKRYGINQKTVAKWKKRTAVKDLPTGPKDAHSTVLGIEDEAIIVAFRKHTLLPLDDCLYALQATIPHLTRSSLNRIPIGQRVGPLIVDETAGRPYAEHAYAREWRAVARAAGIPDAIWNMDARAGGISEADDAGAELDEIRSAAGHSQMSTTVRYIRGTVGKSRKVARLRQAHRAKQAGDSRPI
ncbi:hypothetical protein QOZ94_004195 [Xanthobacter agilis]|uniref:Integrase n=1 Tax=Xanthobacter agilis TaxID=47492 RepID=A0ABU0LJQ9_XANAG|nr:hypothetical protein [Xanthobacter agilis]